MNFARTVNTVTVVASHLNGTLHDDGCLVFDYAARSTGRVLDRPDALSDNAQDLDARSFDCWPVLAKARQQGHIEHRPELVVLPINTDEVARVLRWANATGTPVVARGLGSSVVGRPLLMKGGICLDVCCMKKLLSVDTTNMLVSIEAGRNGGELEDELARVALRSRIRRSRCTSRPWVAGWQCCWIRPWRFVCLYRPAIWRWASLIREAAKAEAFVGGNSAREQSRRGVRGRLRGPAGGSGA